MHRKEEQGTGRNSSHGFNRGFPCEIIMNKKMFHKIVIDQRNDYIYYTYIEGSNIVLHIINNFSYKRVLKNGKVTIDSMKSEAAVTLVFEPVNPYYNEVMKIFMAEKGIFFDPSELSDVKNVEQIMTTFFNPPQKAYKVNAILNIRAADQEEAVKKATDFIKNIQRT